MLSFLHYNSETKMGNVCGKSFKLKSLNITIFLMHIVHCLNLRKQLFVIIPKELNSHDIVTSTYVFPVPFQQKKRKNIANISKPNMHGLVKMISAFS